MYCNGLGKVLKRFENGMAITVMCEHCKKVGKVNESTN